MTNGSAPEIIPSLRYRDAPAAIEWLGKALGFAATMVIPGDGGTVAHAELAVGAAVIMLGSVTDGSDGRLPTEQGPAANYLVVPDVQAVYDAATAAGAEVLDPLSEKDYGGLGFSILDPERNIWSVGSYRPGTP